jgi:translation initiation factor IF-1
MNKQNNDVIEVEGVVTILYPNTVFQVKLDSGGEILAHLSGKMRKRYIRLTVGDRVRLEISKYDLTKGRIVYRLTKRQNFNSTK